MKAIFKLLVFTITTFVSYFVFTSSAYAATLYLSPASRNIVNGSTFTVTLLVDTQGQAANAFEATVQYPNHLLQVTSVSNGGSICTIWVSQPSYNNQNGSASFTCGRPSPGYSGSNGTIGSITFRAISEGSATASLSGARVLANDGQGTNILSSTRNGTYAIVPPPPTPTTPQSAVSITSSTHPDQEVWYSHNNPSFSWGTNSGINAVSYEFNQSPDTIPDTNPDTSDNQVTFENIKDGVWYFHIRFRGANGWSQTVHFKIQIDTHAPEPVEIDIDPSGRINKRPLIAFTATDSLSGIDRYELRIDNGEWMVVESPYQPPFITPGEHAFSVRAYDKAQNYSENTVTVFVEAPTPPVITTPKNGSRFLVDEEFDISGRGIPGAQITIYKNGEEIATDIKVNEDGTFVFPHCNWLVPGKYQITATQTIDGITSEHSDPVTITIDPSLFTIGPFRIPAFTLFIVCLILILILLLILIVLIVRHRKEKQTYQGTDQSLDDLHAELNQGFREIQQTVSRHSEGVTYGHYDENYSKTNEQNLIQDIEKTIKHTTEKIQLLRDKNQKDHTFGDSGN